MFDFVKPAIKYTKNFKAEVYPRFTVKKTQDLMIRGGDFYAIWDYRKGMWSTDEQDAIDIIDSELDEYAKEQAEKNPNMEISVLRIRDADSGYIDVWHKYVKQQMRETYVPLDETLVFADMTAPKNMYSSKKLSYSLSNAPCPAWDELTSTLYKPEELHKIEWCIGSIVSGYSKKLHKFAVLYGAPGSGKSTIISIIQKLFDGYYSVFSAKDIGSANAPFALEPFKTNPLVAIEHDADLSKIENNITLNSLISHELIVVNEKYKQTYYQAFYAFLIAGTNKPVKITDAKSGLLRRLIDIYPSGNTIPNARYKTLMGEIDFELGGIAKKCLDIFMKNPNYYDDYVAENMLSASNDFYNFVEDSYLEFCETEPVTLKFAWSLYQKYCEDARVPYPMSQRAFKEELKNYFKEYSDRGYLDDGTRVRSVYYGFIKNKFSSVCDASQQKQSTELPRKFILDKTSSILDEELKDMPAQYANDEGTPRSTWDCVKTKLSDIDTKKLHFVKIFPENHIVIDFDLKDSSGKKSKEANLAAIEKWPLTYAEFSKSGSGIHLHYFYNGDVTKLSRIYDSDGIEIKVYTGNSSLRRKLSYCNDCQISTLNGGLPLKEEKMINTDFVVTEKSIRIAIKKNLLKEIHPGTKPSIDFIYKILKDAYDSGVIYDCEDLKPSVIKFASQSTNHAEYCLKLCQKMHFSSEKESDCIDIQAPIVFYDVEVFPNLFLINWKYRGQENKCVRMINPSPEDVEKLFKYRLIGFNNREYDNHMIYARSMGYTNIQLYNLSRKIIKSKDKGERRNAMFKDAFNLSYTDIYDFSRDKKSLKKWEIDLGLEHKELGLDWDSPVPEEKWSEVAEYCDVDVINTEKVFDHLEFTDFLAREILADLAGMTVNDTTNTLTAKIIFGNDRNPQTEFNYRNLGDSTNSTDVVVTKDGTMYSGIGDPEYTRFTVDGKPVFPGYKFENGVSTYRGEEVGEGGRVYANTGYHTWVALLDIASMHPSSAIAEQLFGKYTAAFEALKTLRIYVKHKDLDSARKMFDGKLEKWLTDDQYCDAIAYALKIAINAVYGMTSAKFPNKFKDPRNIDNIVAKRGALFMINLQHEVENRGYVVAHIKTDSIKIPNADKDIITFVMDYGKMYGYSFEHEATYEKMCLVNNAVYIAKYAKKDYCMTAYGYIPEKNEKHESEWTATGAEFQRPYVFKTLFSKEPIEFKDYWETKEVSTAMYLDMNESLPQGEHNFKFIGKFGCFCPVTSGGGELVAERVDKGIKKYVSVTGTKGYRWLETNTIAENNLEYCIDISYYRAMVDSVISHISEFVAFDEFVD